MGVALLTPIQDRGAPDDARERRPVQADATPAETAVAPASAARKFPPGLADFGENATFGEVRACPGGVAPDRQEVTDQADFAGVPTERCATCRLAARRPTRLLADGSRALPWRDTRAATATRQQEQRTPELEATHGTRSGTESTHAELKGRHGASNLRVRRKARVELAMCLEALSLSAGRTVQHHNRVRAAARAMTESGDRAGRLPTPPP